VDEVASIWTIQRHKQ